MKQLRVLLLSPGWDASPSQGQPQQYRGFVWVLEIQESPGILFWHFPGLESLRKLMQVLESPGNLPTLVIKFKNNFLQDYFWISIS